MVATASSAASEMESIQFSASTEPVQVGVAVRLGSDGSTGNRSESPASLEENCAPMDLSSGGNTVATPTFMMAAAAARAAATPTSLADSILNARRLAEFVRAQQALKHDEEKPATPPPMVPRKRAWPELQLDLSAMVSEKLKKKEDLPSSPTSESNESNEGGAGTPPSKEVKKRRLDQLLSQKFSGVNENESPPPNSEVGAALPAPPAPPTQRRDSKNRRKRSSPILSLRPNSELLEQKNSTAPPSPAPEAENNPLKNQILQLHLAQAALMAGGGFPPGNPVQNPANPLLYYGYYAQMIQGLQSQQQKLLEQLTNSSALKTSLSSPLLSKVCFF